MPTLASIFLQKGRILKLNSRAKDAEVSKDQSMMAEIIPTPVFRSLDSGNHIRKHQSNDGCSSPRPRKTPPDARHDDDLDPRCIASNPRLHLRARWRHVQHASPSLLFGALGQNPEPLTRTDAAASRTGLAASNRFATKAEYEGRSVSSGFSFFERLAVASRFFGCACNSMRSDDGLLQWYKLSSRNNLECHAITFGRALNITGR